MACSDTCDPIANLLLICFSILEIVSWSSSVVNPSAPESQEVGKHKISFYRAYHDFCKMF